MSRPLRRYIAREKGKDERTLTAIRVLKRSIDARQRTISRQLEGTGVCQ